MTLDQLRIFVAVAEREHLTRAAQALNLSPSAVSAALRALEDRYGLKLFHRVGRHIEMTEAARAFLPQARAALAATAAAELALIEHTTLEAGTLAIEASQTVAAYWLPEQLMAYRRRYPRVELAVRIGNSRTVGRAVLEGTADLGFIEGEIDEPAFGMRVVAADRLTILAAPDHPWAAPGRRVLPHEIVAGSWVLREEGSGTRSAFEASLLADGIDPAELPIELVIPSNEAVLAALRAGGVVGVASERVAETALAAGQLARVDYPLRPRAFRMLWHKERYRTRAARAFAAILPGELR